MESKNNLSRKVGTRRKCHVTFNFLIVIYAYSCYKCLLRFVNVSTIRNSLNKCQKFLNTGVTQPSIKPKQVDFSRTSLSGLNFPFIQKKVASQPVIEQYCYMFLLTATTTCILYLYQHNCFCHILPYILLISRTWNNYKQETSKCLCLSIRLEHWLWIQKHVVRCYYQLCDCRKTFVMRKLHLQSSSYVLHHY